MTLVIENAQIVLPDRVVEGALCLEDGRITDIREGAGAPDGAGQVIDAEGDWLIPGCIDLHGDDIEFEIGALGPRAGTLRMPVELGLIQSDKNAAAWGITTKLHAIAYAIRGDCRSSLYARGDGASGCADDLSHGSYARRGAVC